MNATVTALMLGLAVAGSAALARPGMADEPPEDGVLDIGNRKQLFIDETLIASRRGVKFVMNPPHQTGELLITAHQPWETREGAYVSPHCTVMKEGGRIRVWYDFVIGPDSPGYKNETGGGRCMAYAESADGIHFTKPKLGLHDLHGYKETNVLIRVSRGGTVWIDPTAPPQQRYKSQSKGPGRPEFNHRVLHFFSSPDGIHWDFMHKTDIGHCDTQNMALWEKGLGRYVLYARKWQGEYGDPGRHRTVRRLESDDLVHWENELIVLEADETDLARGETPTGQPPVDYHGGTVFRYPDSEGLYIMLADTWWHARRHSGDVRLLVSRDGKKFQRVGERKPFLRLGPPGSFFSRQVWSLPYPIQMGDQLWIYYWGSNRDTTLIVDPAASKQLAGISRAIMRLDGFVSADADYTGGEIVTRLIQFHGNRLELNVDTAAGGSVLVELLDEAGEPIQGFTRSEATVLWGNSVRMPVSWGDNRDTSHLAGKPIKIHLIMQDCKLYAFQFVNQ